MKKLIAFMCLVAAASLSAEESWWMREPIRWVQTNIRETDANLDPRHLVAQLKDMQANVLLMNLGGIVAFYPTKVPFHYPSPYLPEGHDMFGDVLTASHAQGIRVVGRFDFSKTRAEVYKAHPEWFFRQANGQPVIYNGLYSTCINGGYYRVQALSILAEALDRYPLDGLFFNMFGNQARDYSGHYVGLCHCDECKSKYWQMFHKQIPDEPDDDYRKFMFISSREVAAAIGQLIQQKRPQAGYFNYIQEYTDGVMSESNTAVDRPLPLWPYSASENVNRARNSQPGKAAVNLCMQFVDYSWRFATVPKNEIALRLWEDVANGGALAFEVNGTLDQQDRQAEETARPIFRWIAEHQQYYSGETSAARLLLLGAPQNTGRRYSQESFRGLFRLLTEEHVPFAISDNIEILQKRHFDAVVASDWAPAELQQYVASGGKALIVSPQDPSFLVSDVLEHFPDLKGYFRVRDHAALPSLKDTELIMLNGPYTKLKSEAPSPLTLVPPSMIGPPEFVHLDMKDTDAPGIISKTLGAGEVTWIPWDLGALYYRESLPAHAALFHDAIRRLDPTPQLDTDAHPSIEMSLMRQNDRYLLHLINLSGQSQTGYFDPIPMKDIHIKVAGNFSGAETVRVAAKLSIRKQGGYTEFTVPELRNYELVVLK